MLYVKPARPAHANPKKDSRPNWSASSPRRAGQTSDESCTVQERLWIEELLRIQVHRGDDRCFVEETSVAVQEKTWNEENASQVAECRCREEWRISQEDRVLLQLHDTPLLKLSNVKMIQVREQIK